MPRKQFYATKHLEKARRKQTKHLPADKRELWGFLLQQDDRALSEILAHAVATALSTSRMDTLIEALGMDLRAWFTPTAENYFGRLGKQAILADIADMGQSLTGGIPYAKLKKSELAQQAEIVLSRAENAAWLPGLLRPQPEALADDEEDGFDDDGAAEETGDLAEAA